MVSPRAMNGHRTISVTNTIPAASQRSLRFSACRGQLWTGSRTASESSVLMNDLATCCIAALDDGKPAGIYNVGDGDNRSATWFADEVARQAGLPAPQKISRAQAETEFSPMRLAFLASSRIVDVAKMRAVLGIEPRRPEDGIRDSLS